MVGNMMVNGKRENNMVEEYKQIKTKKKRSTFGKMAKRLRKLKLSAEDEEFLNMKIKRNLLIVNFSIFKIMKIMNIFLILKNVINYLKIFKKI